MQNSNDEQVSIVLEALAELQDDSTVPKNVRERLVRTIAALQESCEMSIKIDKALAELDEISEESNLQAYTRTQIWSIVSMLEKRI